MDKRYQVFVSSTYADLKQERQRVIQALMEMDCIPAGMELFPASDDEQWAFIKRVIDDCDYYLIIIGGRYDSIAPDGVSYTEKEFDYAEARGLKIIALLHEEPDSIPVNRSDIDPDLRQKLETFRQKVASNRLVKLWKSADELPGMVALSLSKTIKTYPAVGWVRASLIASEEMLIEINELRKANEELRGTLAKMQPTEATGVGDLADFDSTITINGEVRVSGDRYSLGYTKEWKTTLSWRKLFGLVAPYLMDRPSDDVAKREFAQVVADSVDVAGSSRTIDDQQFKTIAIQFKALGLVSIDYLKTTHGGRALFWTLTPLGEKVMMQERTVKRPKE